MHYLGIDIGSLSCDAALIDEGGRCLASVVVPTGAVNLKAIERARAEVLTSADIAASEVTATVATGYGRDRVPDRLASVTEITCHARGIKERLPATEVLIDIGGQDSKAIRLDPSGAVADFAMNDKCAAGTGRFLEAIARTLELEVTELGALDAQATRELSLSSMCTVFAESEVVSLVAEGAEVSDIVRGLHRAIAARTLSLVKRVARDLTGLEVAMSGGVARNRGAVRAIEELLGCTVRLPTEPDTVGALGAALIARDRARRSG